MENEAEAEQRNWAELPHDALSLIFRKLGSTKILWPAQAVCRQWWKLTFEPHIWHRIDMDLNYEFGVSDEILRIAVARCQGHLEELCIGKCASDALLTYIADQTTGLRCLVLIGSCPSSNEGMAEFVIRCPQLEELQMIKCVLSTELCGVIGRARPELKCFRLDFTELIFNFWDSKHDHVDYDKEALDIANNMQQLRELQIINSEMTNRGLQAILDKCLNLEFLDIRLCHNTNVDAAMKAKLAKIKTVRLPYDNGRYVGEFEARIGQVGRDVLQRDLSLYLNFQNKLEASVSYVNELVADRLSQDDGNMYGEIDILTSVTS